MYGLQGSISNSIRWLDHLAMDIIEQVECAVIERCAITNEYHLAL